MSGAMRKIGEYLGLLEDTGQYDEFDDEPDQHQPQEDGEDEVEDRAEGSGSHGWSLARAGQRAQRRHSRTTRTGGRRRAWQGRGAKL